MLEITPSKETLWAEQVSLNLSHVFPAVYSQSKQWAARGPTCEGEGFYTAVAINELFHSLVNGNKMFLLHISIGYVIIAQCGNSQYSMKLLFFFLSANRCWI